MNTKKVNTFLLVILCIFCIPAFAYHSNSFKEAKPASEAFPKDENGYDLWLRYHKIQDPIILAKYQQRLTQIVVPGISPTIQVIKAELQRGLSGILGQKIPIVNAPMQERRGLEIKISNDFKNLNQEGYILYSKRNITVIGAKTELGALYGTFAFLRLLETHKNLSALKIINNPKTQFRLLNHWDSFSKKRTYFGGSVNLTDWNKLSNDNIRKRNIDYARANASIGINGTVINDFPVNLLRSSDLKKVAILADAYRPYGIRIYLSISLDAPLKPIPNKKSERIGTCETADPLNPKVAQWWKDKAEEIYSLIPDFGGFLVKAGSEGMPGPQKYGRDDADAANMLARALKPHGGIIFWRAFVYNPKIDLDRAQRSYKQIHPLDGKFDSNVILQVKNGPLDYQPREVFHPLWGSMPKTPMMMEFEIEQEYLGRATDLVYLGKEWEEVFSSDTYEKGKGSTIAKIVEGIVDHYKLTGVAGVANMGDDNDWCGHLFAQANWYAFGRLAWDPELNADTIADEWVRMTWGNDAKLVKTITDMMAGSWEAAVNVRSPLGLNFVCGSDHNDPDPAGRVNDFWFADQNGIGYNRTNHQEKGWDKTSSNKSKMGYNRIENYTNNWKKSGTNAVSEYHKPLYTLFNQLNICPEQDLLWFHFVPWDYTMKSGRSLWEELCFKYESGYNYAAMFIKEWSSLKGKIDRERYSMVLDKLNSQLIHYKKWRNTCLEFFSKTSGKNIPLE